MSSLLEEVREALKSAKRYLEYDENKDCQVEGECWCSETGTGYGTLQCEACKVRSALDRLELEAASNARGNWAVETLYRLADGSGEIDSFDADNLKSIARYIGTLKGRINKLEAALTPSEQQQ